MRLLLVSMLYPSSARPTRAMFNYHHLRGIRELGHDVAVISPEKTLPGMRLLKGSSVPPASEVFDGVTVWHPTFYHLPVVGRHFQHLFYRGFVQGTFRKVVKAFRPDHVLIGFAYPDAAAVGPLCEEMELPWSVAVLGSDYHVRRHQRRIKDVLFETLHQAPVIFCPGKALKLAMVDGGIPAGKILDFRNGVDRSIFMPADVVRQPYVLFVGNLVAVKGVDRLLDAWARLGRRDLTLRLVGGGPLRDSLRRRCRELGIERDVEFLDPLPQKEIARQMQRATLLCLPSHSEGMPNVVLEALACGTPVVGSPAGEIPYLIEPGRNGFVFTDDERAAESLAGALESALGMSWDRSVVAGTVDGFTWRAAAAVVMDAVGGKRDGSS